LLFFFADLTLPSASEYPFSVFLRLSLSNASMTEMLMLFFAGFV
jgi:hypothetical protein